MAFEQILGQDSAIQTLRHALDTGRVHHAYRFEGPDGVGKELVAFELAKELVCGNDGTPSCAVNRHRVETLSDTPPHVPLHPDVVLVERGLYGKLLDAAEATGISIEQIRRVVLGRTGFLPHEGKALVFIVRDADELTGSAANALLKTLEEPHDRTHFILLTSRPKRLLPTVLSRSLAVRFAPLRDAVVAEILARHGAPPELAALGEGSASRALRLADADLVGARDAFLRAAFHAIEAPDLAPAIALAESRPDARDALRDQLEALSAHFVGEARAALQVDTAAEPGTRDEGRALTAARRHEAVLLTMRELERNGQPALVLEGMMMRLRAA
ncbi:MAG: DNA polymerase III subunit [Polyangiaceae bacterium]|nr:DNA polymerase III subunit [Polyangiaceae bacterium]